MKRIDLSRWPEIRALFDELVDLEVHERSQRLSHLGKTDPELRHAVETLIANDAVAEEQLRRIEFGTAFFTDLADSNFADPLQLSGRTISHFEILEPIASGGMAVVYHARDVRLDRDVALKFPLPFHAADAPARDRFLREVRAVGALDHPNVCSVYEAGVSEEGLSFLAMPFYAGETLRDRIAARAPLPVDEALGIGRQVASGLACAHAAGIIHRDLKPGNVTILPDGTAKILDFGLARIADASRTRSGHLLGTAAYMAPEQIRGDAVDARADLWALGVMLYEMLTGRRPFSGENEVSVAHAITHDPLTRPSALRSDISRAAETLIVNLLQKDPADRYGSALAVAADAAAIRRGGFPGFRHGVRRRAAIFLRTPGRQRAAVLLILGAMLLASAAFVADRWLIPAPRRPTNNAEAYELYLRGKEYQERAWTMHDWNNEWLNAAETLFRRAVALDSGFALARAQLADALATRQFDVRNRTAAGLEEVRREADAAVRLDRKLGEPHLVLAFYWDMRGDFHRALAEAKLARRYSPDNAETHANVGLMNFKLHRWDAALSAFREAAKLETKRSFQLAALYARLRRHEQAADAYDAYLRIAPNDYTAMLLKAYVFLRWRGTTDSLAAVLQRVPAMWDPEGIATYTHVVVARMTRTPADALERLAHSQHTFLQVHTNYYEPISLVRAGVYAQAGDFLRAASEYETARQLLADSVAVHPDDWQWRIAYAKALAGSGARTEAVQQVRRALSSVSAARESPNPDVLLGAATVYAMVNENDRAIQLLEALLRDPAAGLRATPAYLRADPLWDGLRDDARFRKIAGL